jgi:AraC-like DNA-binding protein
MARRDAPLTIRSRFVAWVLQYVQAKGGDAAALGRRFDVTVDLSEQDPVPWELLRDVSDAAERELPDPFVGLHMALVNQRGSYGVLEFSARTAPTVRHGIQRLMRYQTLVTDRTRFALREEGDRAIIEHRIVGLPFGCGRHSNEFTVALILRRIRELLGPQLVPAEVWFGHARPAEVGELVSFFGTDRMTFGHPFNGVAIPASLLDAPMPSADADLLPVLDQYANVLVEQVPRATDFLGTVEAEIHRDLMNGTPDIETIAERLHMSSRTLQRRLGERDTTFNELLDRTRHRLALKHLSNESLPIAEVAYLLGYSDTRAFLRAFKRWTNTTPTEHRKSVRSSPIA